MPSGFIRGFKRQAACIVVALYGLCVLAPAAALAAFDAAHLVPCLTDDHHHAGQAHSHHDHSAKAHVHEDGTVHQHANHDGDGKDGKAAHTCCCGFACLSALPVTAAGLLSAPVLRAALALPAEPPISGRGPDLLYRPPISLLSL